MRAYALARRARRAELDPVLLLLALADEGPAATPHLDHAALRDAAAAAELCRPAAEPLPASQPVALRDTFGHSIIVHEALLAASARARAAPRGAVYAADACGALCALREGWPVRTSAGYQQSVAALTPAVRGSSTGRRTRRAMSRPDRSRCRPSCLRASRRPRTCTAASRRR